MYESFLDAQQIRGGLLRCAVVKTLASVNRGDTRWPELPFTFPRTVMELAVKLET